jgi:hypothetical protein
MPKLPTDYSKTIIYKIVCLDKQIEYIYVGSTTHFINRKYGHKSVCNNQNDKKYNLKLYSTIRENGGWDNWTMVQIEEYSCNNKREAECREEYWRVELQAQLNMNRCYAAREDLKEYIKIYRESNKEKIKENTKQYRSQNKEKCLNLCNIYRQEHKEGKKQYNKQYYKENKDEYNKRRRELYALKKTNARK